MCACRVIADGVRFGDDGRGWGSCCGDAGARGGRRGREGEARLFFLAVATGGGQVMWGAREILKLLFFACMVLQKSNF